MYRYMALRKVDDKASANSTTSLPRSGPEANAAALNETMAEAQRLYVAQQYVRAEHMFTTLQHDCEATFGPYSRERIAVISNLGMCVLKTRGPVESLAVLKPVRV